MSNKRYVNEPLVYIFAHLHIECVKIKGWCIIVKHMKEVRQHMRYYVEWAKFCANNNLTTNELKLSKALEALTLFSGSFWNAYSKDTLIEATELPKKNFDRILEKFVKGNVIKLFPSGYRINPTMMYNGTSDMEDYHQGNFDKPETMKDNTFKNFLKE